MPEETETSVERIWMIKPGEAPGQIWAGVAHAALFESRDDGVTWTLNDALWKERVAGDWQPGAGGLALHSICPWPGDPQRMAIGVSAAGVWITEDGGKSWRTGYSGMVPAYIPEDQTEDTNVLCVHNMHRAPTQPERLFMQFHGSVYRSDDEGGSWNDIARRPAQRVRVPVGRRSRRSRQRLRDPAERRRRPRHARRRRSRVRNTRRGCFLDRAIEGLPGPEAYLTIYRQAFGTSGQGDELQLYFGATSGDVFGSADAGASWFSAHERLAPVTSVRVA